jgi:hypothetical protein
MLSIGALAALIAVGGFGLVLAATVVVAIGVFQEEHRWTLKHGQAPSLFAWLTRLVLGHYVRKHDDEPALAARPDDAIPWYQRSSGPARR